MSIDRRWPTADGLTARWSALERDWKSVVVGAAIVGLVNALGLQVPW